MALIEQVEGDLQDAISDRPGVSFAHCVSANMRMDAGIAPKMVEWFKMDRQKLRENNACVGIGELAVWTNVDAATGDETYVYNLVTKRVHYEKPLYKNLKMSLRAMRLHAYRHGVRTICMPRVGCGLDRLKWPIVEKIIDDVFKHEHFGDDCVMYKIEIVVYSLPRYRMQKEATLLPVSKRKQNKRKQPLFSEKRVKV